MIMCIIILWIFKLFENYLIYDIFVDYLCFEK